LEKRDNWDSRYLFVMAAIGSAVGLGNVWRFPYVCYQNGGGAFLIPYFIAIFTAGIPLMILEFSIGHWSRGSPPKAFIKIGKKWEWAGWLSVLLPFTVATYYVVVMAWCFGYMIYSIDLRWNINAESFFLTKYLGISNNPFEIAGISLPVLLGLFVIWFFIFIILYKGVKRIGKVVAWTVPIPTILLIILTIRGLTLPGSIDGLAYYLTPDFSKLLDGNVWIAAYAQVFFSLGVAQGIMITYSSFLKRKSDLTNNAFIISLADAGTSFLAGFTVFSIVGYLAISKGIGVSNLGDKIAGPYLTFITYPTAISLLPFAASFFGFIFFIALLTFGIDSAFSMIEPISDGIQNKLQFSKTKTTAILCFLGFIISLIFATNSGLFLLDIADHFIANYGLVIVGLIECIILGWMFNIKQLRDHANNVSEIKIGIWWDYLIKLFIPIFLIILLIVGIYQNITVQYMNYNWTVILIVGVVPILLLILFSFILMRFKNKEKTL
jgi:NSS family neurotransmitter:Na+ symporter